MHRIIFSMEKNDSIADYNVSNSFIQSGVKVKITRFHCPYGSELLQSLHKVPLITLFMS